MLNIKKVCLLFGSSTFEHEISCKSVYSIVSNIDTVKYDFKIIGIDKENNWYYYFDEYEYLKDSNWIKCKKITKLENIVEELRKFDVIFPIIHGKNGEDGKLQGLFEVFDIPYVGCNLVSSAIGFDKEITKIICDNYNIPQVTYLVFHKNDKVDTKLCEKTIGYPMIVKPVNGGSSIGITVAKNKKDLNNSIKEAFKYDNKVIVEKFIKAKELECAVLDDKKTIASSVGEIIACNEFYDYDAKYEKDSEIVIPADINKCISVEIKDYAVKVFKVLGCRGLARVDFLYDIENDRVYFNEINTMPGFTNISMYPKLLGFDGISYKDLISKLIDK